MKRGLSVDSFLKPLGSVPTQAYLSNCLQVADLLDWTFAQTGGGEVWLTSFSISEEFLRRLYFISKKYKVTYNLVLDHKATAKTLRLWYLIESVVSSAHLADNHSKILLVKGLDGRNVAVVTSQNLTRGNRHEAAVVSTDPEIFAKLMLDVNDLISNKSFPLNDLLRTPTAAN